MRHKPLRPPEIDEVRNKTVVSICVVVHKGQHLNLGNTFRPNVSPIFLSDPNGSAMPSLR